MNRTCPYGQDRTGAISCTDIGCVRMPKSVFPPCTACDNYLDECHRNGFNDCEKRLCKNSLMQLFCGTNSSCKRFCGAINADARDVYVGVSDQDQALEAVPVITPVPSKVVARDDDGWPPVCQPPYITTNCERGPTKPLVSCLFSVSMRPCILLSYS
jgi:hypothetical protein